MNMFTNSRRVTLWLVLLVSLFVGGCASTSAIHTNAKGEKVEFQDDDMYVSFVRISDGFSHEATLVRARWREIDPMTGKPTTWQQYVELIKGSTFWREFALVASPATAVAFINGRTGRSIADKSSCRDGNCPPGMLLQNNNLVQSEANSGSVTDVRVDTQVGSRLPCATTNSCTSTGK